MATKPRFEQARRRYIHVTDDDADSESIELVQGRRLHRTLGSSSTITRWVIISFSMIGMFILGIKEEKSEVLDVKGAKQNKNNKHKNYGTSDIQYVGSKKFTMERVQNTRQAALNLITMLQEYYGGKEQSEKM
eukprot:scaffold7310_cov154-Skeletonema_dohrnii-CCMP3373.AAC.12